MIITIFIFITACGGGGTEGTSSTSIVYRGKSSPAKIGSANVDDLALGSISVGFGIPYIDHFEIAEGIHPEREKESIFSLINSLNTFGDEAVFLTLTSHRSPPIPTVAERGEVSSQGACGGSMTGNGNIDMSTGDFSLTISLNGYSNCFATYTGRGKATGKFNVNTMVVKYNTITYTLLTIDFSGYSITGSGTYFIDKRSAPLIHETMNFTFRDDQTGETYWFRDYKVQSEEKVEGMDSYYEINLSGRFYEPVEGYVELSTIQPLKLYAGDVWPSEGIILIQGNEGTKAKLEALSNTRCRITADTDGDGIDDYDSGPLHWSRTNEAPIADAGEDQSVNTGETITLDGTGSSDLEDDPLSYAWAIISTPPGSSVTLSGADTPTPSFTPDVDGTYIISLIVNDGFIDSIPDTVTITASTPLFSPYVTFSTGSPAQSVTVADVNGDGRNDVILATGPGGAPQTEEHVFVYFQTDSGGLATPITYPGGNGYSVDTGDLNGDGRRDIVVSTAKGIGVFPQNSSGTFDPMEEYQTGHSGAGVPTKVRAGDFNGDGLMDVATIDWENGSGVLDIFYQQSTGTLSSTPTSYSVPHGGRDDLAAGDLNGDALTDLAVMSGQLYAIDNFSLLLQTSGGMMDGPYSYDIGGDILSHSIAIGDLNSDGKNDVVLAYGGNRPSSHIAVLYQNGTGTLDPPVSFDAYDIPEAVAVGDVNGDGRDDVVTLHGGWMAAGIFIQDENRALSPYVLVHIPYSSHYDPDGLAIGDVNGDGKNDLVVADPVNGLVILYKN